jgi:3-carboxy-cis,cis-muconate cycloisomerase
MPHKRNPVGCVLTLAAANRVPGLVSSFLSSMVQEHERAAGNWQAEWTTVSAVIQSTGLAIKSMADVAEGLTVATARMRANIESTQGRIFAERAMILLSAKLGREKAHKLLEEATRKSTAQNRHLREMLFEIKKVKEQLLASAKQEKTSGNKD